MASPTKAGGVAEEIGCHVWTAPGWQELFSWLALMLVGAVMCSTFECGFDMGRWP